MHGPFLVVARVLLFVAVSSLLTAVASLVAEYRFWVHGLQQLYSTGSVKWHTGLVTPWHVGSLLPGSGIKSVSPALAARFFTIEPIREALNSFFGSLHFNSLKGLY